MQFRIWDQDKKHYVGRTYAKLSAAESMAHHMSMTRKRAFHAEAVAIRIARVACPTATQFREMRITAQRNERIAGARCGAMGEFAVLDEDRFHLLKNAYEAKEQKP